MQYDLWMSQEEIISYSEVISFKYLFSLELLIFLEVTAKTIDKVCLIFPPDKISIHWPYLIRAVPLERLLKKEKKRVSEHHYKIIKSSCQITQLPVSLTGCKISKLDWWLFFPKIKSYNKTNLNIHSSAISQAKDES